MKVEQVDIAWRPDLSIYASEAFLKTVSREYGWLGGTTASGQLICALPYSLITKSIFTLVRFPVETIAFVSEFSVDDEQEFLNGAVAHFRALGADLVIPATFSTLFRTYPRHAVAAPYGSYVIDLTQSEDALWKKVHSKHRNVIRNAEKKGVAIRSGLQYLEAAYKLTLESFLRSADGFIGRRRVESRLTYPTFSSQVRALGDYVQVLVAEHEGVIQSAAVIPFSHHSAYYMHGGNIASPLTGASNLLQWEAIRRFREMGVRRYDFFGARIDPKAGSKAEGIAKFKERFGGDLHRGYMWKIPFRPVKSAFYSFAATVRSGGDVVDQERYRLKVSGDAVHV
jgi:hypothetical protein